MGWRQREDRRQRRADRSDPGRIVKLWILGCLLPGGLFALGVLAFVVDAIPIATRYGIVWISGPGKNLVAFIVTGLAAAFHVGFAWPFHPKLRAARTETLLAVLAVVVCAIGFIL